MKANDNQQGLQGGKIRGVLLLVSLLMVLAFHPGSAQQQDFALWLQELRAEAKQLGIRDQTLDKALTGLRPLPRVIELDRKQPEVTLTYSQYVQRVLSAARTQHGKELYHTHRSLLNEIGAAYGVQPAVIVALWGIETDFGEVTGNFSVIASLATLAYDGRRSALFRRELLDALRIIDDGHISAKAMLGSWAGAMGQNQFMPSSFRQFAVDYNGDGRRDIWNTLADVFASTANYLARSGWQRQASWGCRATVPAHVDQALVGLEVRKSLAGWYSLGLQTQCGERNGLQQEASLLLPEGPGGPAFLVYHNYHMLLKWNRSTYFALTVGQFADAIDNGK
jgi:membrane-bound lytic murein transglycosylase B